MELTHVYPDLTIHLTLFHAEITDGVPQLLEHCAMDWITPEEIGGYDFALAARRDPRPAPACGKNGSGMMLPPPFSLCFSVRGTPDSYSRRCFG